MPAPSFEQSSDDSTKQQPDGVLRTVRNVVGRFADERGGGLKDEGEAYLKTNGGMSVEQKADGPQTDTGPFSAFAEERLDKSELYVKTGLRPEEYLLQELVTAGGRLKQKEIVEYTGWSSTAVSRLLGQMEDDDRIIRIRIGRENLVFLPGEVSFDSPF